MSTFTGHIDYINACYTYASSQKGVTGSSDKTIKEWDFNSLKQSKNLSCYSSCFALAGTPDDSLIISGHNDGSVKFWSGKSDKPDNMLDLHDDKVTHIEFVKNENEIITMSKDYTIRMVDIRKMSTVYTIGSDILSNYCESGISISTDKKYFAVGSNKGEIYIFDTKTGALEEKMDNKAPNAITSLQWRPYHSQLYVGDVMGFLTVWSNQ